VLNYRAEGFFFFFFRKRAWDSVLIRGRVVTSWRRGVVTQTALNDLPFTSPELYTSTLFQHPAPSPPLLGGIVAAHVTPYWLCTNLGQNCSLCRPPFRKLPNYCVSGPGPLHGILKVHDVSETGSVLIEVTSDGYKRADASTTFHLRMEKDYISGTLRYIRILES
jgi:hypothetical protein